VPKADKASEHYWRQNKHKSLCSRKLKINIATILKAPMIVLTFEHHLWGWTLIDLLNFGHN